MYLTFEDSIEISVTCSDGIHGTWNAPQICVCIFMEKAKT